MSSSPGSSDQAGVTVVIPAYNEENAVGQTLAALKTALKAVRRPHEIVVVDDGSTDRTAETAAAAGVRVIRHPLNSGYGQSLLTGIEAAQYDTVAITDADGTYPVEMLPQLLEFYDRGFHMAVAARQGRHYHSSIGKSALRFFFRVLAEFTCGRKIPDINSGFRVFDRRPVLAQRSAISTGFSFTTTVTLLFMLQHRFVGYMPLAYNQRIGSSKVRLFRDSLRSLQIIITAIAQFNPLKLYLLLLVFDVLGIAFLAVLFGPRGGLLTPGWLAATITWNTLCLLLGAAILALVWMRSASCRHD